MPIKQPWHNSYNYTIFCVDLRKEEMRSLKEDTFDDLTV
jgi:hypothetical protein